MLYLDAIAAWAWLSTAPMATKDSAISTNAAVKRLIDLFDFKIVMDGIFDLKSVFSANAQSSFSKR
jgi:hypothetical protein